MQKSSIKSSKPLSKAASKPGEAVRLNRFLAECGVASRRGSEELILAGEIYVNGVVCTDLATIIKPGQDTVQYLGKNLVQSVEKIYLILNKPAGYVVSRADEYGRKTVYDLLPEAYKNLPYAGRLDKGSEGLLFFCSDGEVVNQLCHPSYGVEKSYRVEIGKTLSKADLTRLRAGVEIEGGLTQPAGIFVNEKTDKGCVLKVQIKEGRKRQIRQMFEVVGAKVIKLKRMQFGPLVLKDLPVGRWRLLSAHEIRALHKALDAKKQELRNKK